MLYEVITVPILLFIGVPLNLPVVVSKLAQDGLFVIEKVKVSFISASFTVGTKLYALSSFILVLGIPLIVGASFVFEIVILKGFKLVLVFELSVTVIIISLVVPTSLFVGVPLNSPVRNNFV